MRRGRVRDRLGRLEADAPTPPTPPRVVFCKLGEEPAEAVKRTLREWKRRHPGVSADGWCGFLVVGEKLTPEEFVEEAGHVRERQAADVAVLQQRLAGEPVATLRSGVQT